MRLGGSSPLTDKQILSVQLQQTQSMLQERDVSCANLQSTIASMQFKIDGDAELTRRGQVKHDQKKQEHALKSVYFSSNCRLRRTLPPKRQPP